MRSILIPTIAALGLLAAPALAQNSSSSSNNSAKSSPSTTAQITQELHQDLSKAGFTDINIVPGSFLVHAKNSKGQMTEMMISPNSMMEITAMKSSGGSSPSTPSAGSNSKTN